MGLPNVLLLAVCTVLLVYHILTLAKFQRVRKDLKRLRNTWNDKSQDENWKWEFERLRGEVRQLQSQMVKMDERLTDAEGIGWQKNSPEPNDLSEIGADGSQDDSNETLYFASANSDAFVDESSLKKEEASDTLYWMELVSDNEALVRPFGNQKAWENALQSPELYIAPVCTFRGSPTSAARITMVNEGTARRENGKWKIVQKIEIKLS